jgi:tetratricopeptide (TPR) repeat protein
MPPTLEAALARLDRLPAVEGAASQDRERARAYGLTALGLIKGNQGDMKGAAITLKQAVALARDVDDQRLLAHALINLGGQLGLMGDFAAADVALEQGIGFARAAGRNSDLAFGLAIRGRARVWQGQDYEAAWVDLEEALRAATELGDRAGIAICQAFIGEVDHLQGRYAESVTPLQEAVALAHEAREWVVENLARSELADAYRLTGNYGQAAPLYRQVIRSHQISGNRGGVARCLECLAFMQIQQAESAPAEERKEYLARAARIFGAAEALRNASGKQMNVREPLDYTEYVARLRTMMDDRARVAAWAEGRRATIDEVLGLAAETDQHN